MNRLRLFKALQEFQRHEIVSVAFVLDEEGALVAHAGIDPAFSRTGHFAARGPHEEPNTNLFLTRLGEDHQLGVLFDEGTPIQEIRQLVAAMGSDLDACLQSF